MSPIGTVTSVTVSSRAEPSTSWTSAMYRFASGVWNQYAPEQATFISGFGNLIAGVRGVSQRIGADWLPFGPGLNDQPTVMVSHNNVLHAFGPFTAADQQLVFGASRLGPNGWEPVGSGVHGTIPAVIDAESFGGDLFVSGRIPTTGQMNVVRYDGVTWAAASGGFVASNSGSGRLRIAAGELYFLSSGVRKWNGSQFVQIGGAFPGGFCHDISVFNGVPHATGNAVYRLENNAWVQAAALRPGFGEAKWCAVWNNRFFVYCDAFAMSTIDELVGGTLVEQTPNFVRDWTEWRGQLVGVRNSDLLFYNGTTWSTGSPYVGAGGSHITVHQGDLIIASTSSAGGRSSMLFSRLSCCPADFDGNGQVTINDIFAFLNAWFSNDPNADMSGGGVVSIDDIFIFLNLWFAGCP